MTDIEPRPIPDAEELGLRPRLRFAPPEPQSEPAPIPADELFEPAPSAIRARNRPWLRSGLGKPSTSRHSSLVKDAPVDSLNAAMAPVQ